jgi:hypothetical protein
MNEYPPIKSCDFLCVLFPLYIELNVRGAVRRNESHWQGVVDLQVFCHKAIVEEQITKLREWKGVCHDFSK